MRLALLISVSLSALATFGCKKASTPEPIEDDAAAVATTDAAAEAEEAEGAAEPTDGATNDAGTTASDDAAAATGDAATALEDAGHATEETGAAAAATGKPADPNPTAPGVPAGTVTFVVHSAAGGTGADAVSAALEKNKQRVRGCYGKALANDPSTSGVLKLRATISPEGVVEKVDVIGGTLSPSPLVQCTVATVKATKIAGAAAPQTKATFDVKLAK